MLLLNWNSVQQEFLGGGNLEEKYVRNLDGSVGCLRDATSAMTLYTPEM